MDLTLDNALATWDLLEKHLSAFIAAWEQGLTPAIGDHLPQGTGSLRRLALIELIKADLDYRFASGEGWLLEKYVEAFPELATPAGPPCDLIYEEFHVRRSKGYVVSREEFFTRFPGRREELERLLGAVDASQSTALLAEKQLIHLQEGDQIDDFDLLARVGQGAFGSVFLARQRSISRLVALKVSADRGQEARMLAQLDHPNIVRVYDQRRLPERQLRLVYMQFASGGTLADLVERARGSLPQDRSGAQLVSLLEESLERRGLGPMVDPSVLRSLVKLAWPEVVCRLGAQLAQALDYAHRQGVLHRDVKPANILLAADGTPKLADFNISSLASHPNVGAAAYFGGSLAYMSPEHLEAFNPQHARQAEELDGRADLYSLAVVLWELLCGKKPFTDARVSEDWSETLDAMTARRRATQWEAIGLPSGTVAQSVMEVLKRALSPNVDERPTDGSEFAQELLLCIQPHTERLLRFSGRGWRQWARNYPALAMLTAVTIPNAIAGRFNYAYNKVEIIDKIKLSTEVSRDFEFVQRCINGVAFPLGALLVLVFIWPVAKRLKNAASLKGLTPEGQASLRRYALRLGHLAAVIGALEWLVAGFIYPAAMQALGHPLAMDEFVHFWVSLTLCGLVAAAYPFFGVTYLTLRVFFPALLQRGAIDLEAEVQLRRLAQQCGVYFMIACGVPIIGLMLMILHASDYGTEYRRLLAILAVVSLAGITLAFKTYSVILRDIAVLIQVVRPVDPFGIDSSSKL